jgi:predicted Zn-dependent protease
MKARATHIAATSTVLWVGLTLSACALNPATGKRQLSLISEEQEIQMGRQAAQEIRETLGFVENDALQTYVQQIGREEAAISERPNLPWEFHVVDDPTPNAFALPGGFIYVTRGMMALMTSEAELAGVLGHEIGHVTARDTVNQLSKQQFAQLGLGLGSIFVPEMQQFGSLAGAGLSLLFLKYGRDDEREADSLGFEYMRKRGYDVSEFDDVFAALERLESTQQSALPTFLSTHPAPAERVQTAQERAASLPPQENARVGRDAFMERIDNLVYGKDPRDGFFRGSTFYHPRLRFAITFPEGWKTENLTRAVVAVSPRNDAALELRLTGDADPARALRRFFSQPGVAAGRAATITINGAPAALAQFQAQSEQGLVAGLVGYVARGGRTYQVVGYTAAQAYRAYAGLLEQTIRSLEGVTDPEVLNVRPKRIDVIRLERPTTLDRLADGSDAVSLETLAILNQVPTGTAQLPAGQLVKRITS